MSDACTTLNYKLVGSTLFIMFKLYSSLTQHDPFLDNKLEPAMLLTFYLIYLQMIAPTIAYNGFPYFF